MSQPLHCTHVKFSTTGSFPSSSGSDRLVDLLTPPPPRAEADDVLEERLLVPPPPYDAAYGFSAPVARLNRFRAEAALPLADLAPRATDRTAAAVVDLPRRRLLLF